MAQRRKTKRTGVESIQEELATIGADIGSLSSTIGEFASSEARDAIRSIRERLNEIASEAGAASRARVESVQEMIQERPLASVAAAFGLGFILAMIVRR